MGTKPHIRGVEGVQDSTDVKGLTVFGGER
jgi:hypothetical protein